MKKILPLLFITAAHANIGFVNPFDNQVESFYGFDVLRESIEEEKERIAAEVSELNSQNDILNSPLIFTQTPFKLSKGKVIINAPTAPILPIPTLSQKGQNNYVKAFNGIHIIPQDFFRKLAERKNEIGSYVPLVLEQSVNGTTEVVAQIEKPLSQAEKDSILEKMEKELMSGIMEEVTKMSKEKLPLFVQPVLFKDDTMVDFLIKEKYKGDKSRVIKTTSGIYADFSMPLIDNNVIPVCYIVVDKDTLQEVNEIKFSPIRNHLGDKAFSSYYAGYLMGHCLAELEESYASKLVHKFTMSDAKKLNIHPLVYDYYFPKGLQSRNYLSLQNKINALNITLQYKERVADAFGLLWANKNHYKDVVEEVSQYRKRFADTSIFQTQGVLDLFKKERQLHESKNVSQLWKVAKDWQSRSGVTKSLTITPTDKKQTTPQYEEIKQLNLNEVYIEK